MTGAGREVLVGMTAQRATAAWLTRSPVTVDALAYVVAGLRGSQFRLPYQPDTIPGLIRLRAKHRAACLATLQPFPDLIFASR